MPSSDAASLSLSSPLSAPSLRSSPFSILPPELTQLIIEHTVPHSFYSETYQSRQSTLRSLCLVSKSFHHFARPLLLAMLWTLISRDYEVWKTVHAKGEDKLLCHEIIFETEDLTLPLDLPGHARLRTLIIGGSMTTLDLSVVNQLTQLSVLRLCSINISVSTTFSLRNPHEMTMFEIDSVTNLAQILNPSTLPSLRLFAYYDEYGLLPSIVQALDPILPQLHAVSLRYHSIKSLLSPDLLSKLNPITLIDGDFEDLQDPAEELQVSYLRFEDNFGQPATYEEVAYSLSQARLSLPLTLFLPLSASPGAPDERGGAPERSKLLQVCTERGIEVVYEDQPKIWHLNSGFSEHFTEKMREERRKREGRI